MLGNVAHPGRQNECTPTTSSGNPQCDSMTNVSQSRFLMIAGATQNELARQAKYLKVKNEILRTKSPKRITITPKGEETGEGEEPGTL